MRYWNQENFEGLRAIAEDIVDDPDLQDFAQYCRYREQGLRKEAFRVLAQFISQAGEWSFAQRKRFVDWLLLLQFYQPDVHQLIPHPLKEQVVRPTLAEWSQSDPSDPVPFRWRGVFFDELEMLEQAVRLDPQEEIARIILIKRHISNIEYATHHLPEFFIGEPQECLQWAEQARHLLESLHHPENTRLEHELHEAVTLVKDWITFLAIGTEDFATWCAQQGRIYPWTKVYYYSD